MNYFIISLITSTIQSLIIIKSNIIFGTLENMILLLGIRIFVCFSPIISILFRKWDLFSSIIIIIIGLISVLSKFHFSGALILALGFSITNFLLRKRSLVIYSNTSFSRIAFHSGNILAGFIITFFQNYFIFWAYCLITISYGLFRARPLIKEKEICKLSDNSLESNKFKISNIKNYLIWLFFGLSLGMQTFSISVILPQHLSDNHDKLPRWFGILICSYSLFAIISLIPSNFLKKDFTRKGIFLYLIFGAILISLIRILNLTDFYPCLIWVIIFSLVISFFAQVIDSSSAKDSSLIIKEFGIGIGAGLTVFIMRSTHNIFIVSLISVFFSIIGYFINKKLFCQKNNY